MPVEMPEEGNKVLKYNHGEKSIKAPLIIYADLECLLEKISTCHNNLEQSYTEKKTIHKASSYSIFTQLSFDSTKYNVGCYR